jgi:hypothetical protein
VQVPRGTFRPQKTCGALHPHKVVSTIIIIQKRPLGNACEFPIFSLDFVRYSIYFPILFVLPAFFALTLAQPENSAYTYL